MKTIKELANFIWYLENKYSLLDLNFNNVYIWQAYRMEFYYKLGKLLGVFNFNRNKNNKNIINMLKNSFFYYPFIGLKKKDKLFFTHQRSKKFNNEYIDIYSYFLIEIWKKENTEYYEVEEPFNGIHIRKFNKNKIYTDYFILYRNLFAKLNPYKKRLETEYNNTTKYLIEDLTKEIDKYKIIDETINFKEFFIDRTIKFNLMKNLYIKLLNKTKPSEIYVIVGYGKPELISAARKLNIKVIELQHGTFSKYHLGYSYPNYNKELKYFPDEFWVWNDYWKNLIDFPISKEKIKIFPFLYLENLKKQYQGIKKEKNTVLVLGQDILTDKIAEKILEHYDYFSKFKLFFKLHPEEYDKEKKYKFLKKLSKKNNVIIYKDVDLYELMARSEYQAGVFSTALYEGIEFGCKTILFNLPGIEYMEKFIQEYNPKIF